MVNQLTAMLVKRIQQAYKENSKTMPKNFGKGAIKINTLVSNLRDSRVSDSASRRASTQQVSELARSRSGEPCEREAPGRGRTRGG